MNKKLHNEKGASVTVEMLFFIIFFVAVFSTILDFSLFFFNRQVVANAAQNGARVAAVFGGTTPNAISMKYGVTDVTAECHSFGATSPVSCAVYDELKQSNSTVNAQVKSIDCGPGITNKIGDRTYCEVVYSYKGLPLSGLSLGNVFNETRVRMTAESEVVHR